MLIDYRFKTLNPIRSNVNWVLRPLEYIMMAPRNIFEASSEYFTTRGTLDKENQDMKARQAELSLLANQSEYLLVENQNLRQLMDLQKQVSFKTLPVEILFNPPNPISQRIVINGVVSGSSDEGTSQTLAVPDVMGQLTQNDLQFTKTPWGRYWLGYGQSVGPLWDLT